MKQEVLKEFIQKVWNEGDINAIPKYIAEKYTIVHDPADPWEGMELDVADFQERVSVSRAPVPDQAFDIQELYEKEDSICITWRWSATHLGEIAGIPPSGKKITMSGATVYYFQNNLITGHWQVADRLGVFQQMQSNQNE
ncbi:ester cyclase [Pseudoalteromonas luteoviolacea]|uniref:ester cyclase n=1 Tax=Pseudoalteromonas luteoviolacea TaxID=43657 RepID=UPI001F443649|nr:ester cyclase [Pseudoalteromonas luteoviolacea]MCF6443039.1 ester cyclase [Pseudoalteromonas luteoviolacea]